MSYASNVKDSLHNLIHDIASNPSIKATVAGSSSKEPIWRVDLLETHYSFPKTSTLHNSNNLSNGLSQV